MSKPAPKLAWVGIGALAVKDQVGLCANLPDGLYRRSFGEWRVVLNGKNETSAKQDDHPELAPFDAYVEFLGWPAGIIGPGRGVLAAGDAANEDTFIAAIEAELGCDIKAALERKP